MSSHVRIPDKTVSRRADAIAATEPFRLLLGYIASIDYFGRDELSVLDFTIYSAETLTRLAAVLEEASARNGRRIFLLSDEPYNRIVFGGHRFRTPAAFYPYTLVPTATARRSSRQGSASATWRCRPRCRTGKRCARPSGPCR